jgi:hypothetical protein
MAEACALPPRWHPGPGLRDRAPVLRRRQQQRTSPRPHACARQWQASEGFTGFSKPVVSRLGDRGPSADVVTATMDLDAPGRFQVVVFLLLKTRPAECCECGSTLGRQSQRPGGQLLTLAPVGSSSPIVSSSRSIPFNRRLTHQVQRRGAVCCVRCNRWLSHCYTISAALHLAPHISLSFSASRWVPT